MKHTLLAALLIFTLGIFGAAAPSACKSIVCCDECVISCLKTDSLQAALHEMRVPTLHVMFQPVADSATAWTPFIPESADPPPRMA